MQLADKSMKKNEAHLSAKDQELEKKLQEHIAKKKDSVQTPQEPAIGKRASTMHSKKGSTGEDIRQEIDPPCFNENSKAMQAFKKVFQTKPMPKFAIYSRLDKNLLQLMLIKATEFQDAEIANIREKYFNPEKDENEESDVASCRIST